MYKKKLHQLNTDEITQLLHKFIDKDKKNEKKNHTKTGKTINVSSNHSSRANRNYWDEPINVFYFALTALCLILVISAILYFFYMWH
jgi:hypothetical protein